MGIGIRSRLEQAKVKWRSLEEFSFVREVQEGIE